MNHVSLQDIPKILPYLPPHERQLLLAELAKLEELKQKKAAQDNFMDFVKQVWPTFIGGRHHAKMANAFERVVKGELKRLIVCMPPRHCLRLDTPILTTEGWKTMETLQPGDYVFGPDGLPTQVLGKSEVHRGRELWKVTDTYGNSVWCDDGHIWNVAMCRKRPVFKNKTAKELGERTTKRRVWVPDHVAVQFDDAPLPIDPYVFGVWLGDGAALQATFTAADADALYIRAEIERRGYTTKDRATRYTFGVDAIKPLLREMGVLGNKHIPAQYLRASVEQRLSLLKGLMDTDGNVSKQGQCFLATSSPVLRDQYLELLWGLGIKAGLATSRAVFNGRDYGEAYRIGFYHDDVACLPRKQERATGYKKPVRRYISFERDGVGDVQCIEVDRTDGLFLAGHALLVTHNTKSEFASYLLPAWFLGKFPHKKVIQCSHTAELAVGFGRKVRNLVDTEVYNNIFPELKLSADSKAAGRWNTSKKGDYFAIGVGGAVTGKGADILIVDDPHALEISTPIPTPNGFVALGDLKVGDEVFGPDGWPTKVVAKSPVYQDRELYEVKTYDGEIIYADAKHLWNVRTSTRVKDPYRNLTTEELVEPRSSPFMIPRHSAVQYPPRDLPIDPWVLGAWLGDGTSSNGRMTAHPDDAIFMRAEFKRRGYETTDLTDKFNFGVVGLWTQLKALGVLNNKHIPEEYMTASYLQRMDLLCGLMDTDGNVTKEGQCAFHNKDARLVDQVVELLHSLGRKCQRRTYQTNGTFGPCLMHRVTFKLKDCALMPRKRYRTRTTHDKQHRSITVRKTEQRGAVQCITVERDDGLFLAGRGYVVTHNSEQEAALAETNPEIYDKTYEWYTSGPRQRLQPGGAIIIVMTRWSKRDLVGRILQDAAANNSLNEWEVVEFPAILPSGNPLWPQFWSLEELEKVKRDVPNSKWQAQYQQNPVSESAAIVKREWWRTWERDSPPACDFILQCWDTAFEKTQRADYSACTTWGVFYQDDENGLPQANIILLNAFRDRMEFPELKKVAIEEFREWDPDSIIIEKKASGSPLIYEMRAMGIPVQEFTPTRGNDKISRLNAVADIFASGRVWAPATRWAEEVIDEVAEFPAGTNDDYTDTVSMAMHRFRRGGYVRTNLDEPDEPEYFKSNRRKAFY